MNRILVCTLMISFFAAPVALFAADDFIVLDRGYDQDLYSVSSAGLISRITSGVPWERAASVAIDSAGNYIVVVDVYGPYGYHDGVYQVTPNGEITEILAGDMFSRPRGIAIDADGNYIVVEEGYDFVEPSILRVSPTGTYVVIHEGDPLVKPTDVAIDANGHYVITDRGSTGVYWSQRTTFDENGAVYRIDPVTREITTVRSSIDEDGNVKMDDLMGHLAGIAIDSTGNYIIAQPPAHLEDGDMETPTGDASILRLRPNGDIIDEMHVGDVEGQICIPLGIAIDDNGDYLLADAVGTTSQNGRLLRVTTTGEVSVVVNSETFSKPGYVAPVRSAAQIDDPVQPGTDGDQTDTPDDVVVDDGDGDGDTANNDGNGEIPATSVGPCSTASILAFSIIVFGLIRTRRR